MRPESSEHGRRPEADLPQARSPRATASVLPRGVLEQHHAGGEEPTRRRWLSLKGRRTRHRRRPHFHAGHPHALSQRRWQRPPRRRRFSPAGGDADFLGGAGEALVTGGGLEVAQAIEWREGGSREQGEQLRDATAGHHLKARASEAGPKRPHPIGRTALGAAAECGRAHSARASIRRCGIRCLRRRGSRG